MPTPKTRQLRRPSLGSLSLSSQEDQRKEEAPPRKGGDMQLPPLLSAVRTEEEEEEQQPGEGLSVRLRANKRGGARGRLQDGAKISLPEGSLGKKEALTLSQLEPASLAECCPQLRPDQEALVSAAYRLDGVRQLRHEAAVTVPLAPDCERPHARLRLLQRPDGAGDWRELPWRRGERKDTATFETNSSGIFVLVRSPVDEYFTIGEAGGMLHFKLHPIITLRVPKHCFEREVICRFLMQEMAEQRVQQARQVHRSDLLDVVSVSPVFVFEPPAGVSELHRSCTLKLPLPEWMRGLDRRDALDRLAIMRRHGDGDGGWRRLETRRAAVRLTRDSIRFDTKLLGSFCLLQAASAASCARAASVGFPRLVAAAAGRQPGQLLLFADLQRRSDWRLAVDCVQQAAVAAVTSDRLQLRGWRLLHRRQEQQRQQQQQQQRQQPPTVKQLLQQQQRMRRRRRRGAAAEENGDEEDGDGDGDGDAARPISVAVGDGAEFRVAVSGDFRLRVGDGPDAESVRLQYHSAYDQRPFLLQLLPTQRTVTVANDFYAYLLEVAEEEQLDPDSLQGLGHDRSLTFKCNIELFCAESDEPLSQHELCVDFKALKEYLDLKPPPPPPESQSDLSGDEQDDQGRGGQSSGEDWRPQYPHLLKLRIYELDPQQARAESFQRLTAPRRNARAPVAHRDPRALSRRSLQTIAQQVTSGCELAAQLGLPDSAVSVLGYESLPTSGSAGVSRSLTYRVLLYWKRSRAGGGCGGDAMAQELAEALRCVGRGELAEALLRRLAEGRELTGDCLDA